MANYYLTLKCHLELIRIGAILILRNKTAKSVFLALSCCLFATSLAAPLEVGFKGPADNSASAIIALAKLNTDGSAAFAYVVSRYMKADFEAQQISTYRTNQNEKAKYLSEVVKFAKKDTKEFITRGGYAERLMNEGVNLGKEFIANQVKGGGVKTAGSAKLTVASIAMAVAVKSLPTEEWIRKGLDKWDPKKKFEFSDDLKLQLNAWGLQAALYGKDEASKALRQAAVEFLGIKVGDNPDLTLEVRDQRFKNAVIDTLNINDQKAKQRFNLVLTQLEGIKSGVSATNSQVDQANQMLIENRAVMEKQRIEIAEAVEIIKQKKKSEEEALRIRQNRDEIAGFFGLAEAGAILAKSPEMAIGLNKTGRLMLSFYDLAQSGLKFSTNPLAYMNSYATLLSLAADFMGSSSQGPSVDQEILKGIQSILVKLDEMEQTMKANFMDTNLRMERHNALTLSEIAKGNAKVEAVRQINALISRQIERLGKSTEANFQALSHMILEDWQGNCFPNLNSRYVPLKEKEQLSKCRDKYVKWTLGEFQLSSDVGGESLGREMTAEQSRTVMTLAKSYSNLQGKDRIVSTLMPAQWLDGADRLIALGRINPQFKDEFSKGMGDKRVVNVIQAGNSIDSFLSTIALDQVKDGYQLNARLLNDIVDRYEIEIRDQFQKFNAANLKIQTSGLIGPQPFLGIHDNFVPGPAETYLNPQSSDANIPLCGNAKITYTELPSDPNYYKKQFESVYSDPPIRLNPNFAQVIDKNVLWLQRIPEFQAKVSACFSELNIDFKPGAYQAGQQLSMSIDINVEYTDPVSNQRIPRHVVQRIKVSRHANMFLNFGPAIPVHWALFWFFNLDFEKYKPGASCPFVNQPLPSATPQYEALVKTIEERLRVEQQRSLQRLSEAMRFETTSAEYIAQLLLVLKYGLNNSNENVSKFTQWLLEEKGLPDATSLISDMFQAGAGTDEGVQFLEQRLAIARAFIKDLSNDKTLRPPLSVFAPRIKALIQLTKGEASPSLPNQKKR